MKAIARLCRFGILSVAVVSASWCVPGPSDAGIMLLDEGTSTIRTDSGFNIGMSFTVGSDPVYALGLGVWDGSDATYSGDGNGLLYAHEVGLWSNTGTLLASATVPAGTAATPINEYRFVPLTQAVWLYAGQTYRLGALWKSGENGEPFRDHGGSNATFDSHFTVGQGFYNASAPTVLAFPASPAGLGSGYIGPNLQFALVPEPSTVVLLVAGGLIGLVALLRRRR